MSTRPDKSELVAAAIGYGVPSYEAWEMTAPELADLIAAHQPPEREPVDDESPVGDENEEADRG